MLIAQMNRNRERFSEWSLTAVHPSPTCPRFMRLRTGLNSVGRTADNNIRFALKQEVSRRHSLIRVNAADNKIYIKDLKSQNGTFLHEIKLMSEREVEIQENDLIGFGKECKDSSILSYKLVRQNALPNRNLQHRPPNSTVPNTPASTALPKTSTSGVPNTPASSALPKGSTSGVPNTPASTALPKASTSGVPKTLEKTGTVLINISTTSNGPASSATQGKSTICQKTTSATLSNHLPVPGSEVIEVSDDSDVEIIEERNKDEPNKPLSNVTILNYHYTEPNKEVEDEEVDVAPVYVNQLSDSESHFYLEEEVPIPVQDPLSLEVPCVTDGDKNIPNGDEYVKDPLALNDAEKEAKKEVAKAKPRRHTRISSSSSSSEEEVIVRKHNQKSTKKRENCITYSSDEETNLTKEICKQKTKKRDKKNNAVIPEKNNNIIKRKKSTDKIDDSKKRHDISLTKDKDSVKNVEKKKEKTPENNCLKRKSDSVEASELPKFRRIKRLSVDSNGCNQKEKEKENENENNKPHKNISKPKEAIMLKTPPSVNRKPIKPNLPVKRKTDEQINRKESRQKKLKEIALKHHKEPVLAMSELPQIAPIEKSIERHVPKIASKPPLYTPPVENETVAEIEASQSIIIGLPTFNIKNIVTGDQPYPLTAISQMYRHSEMVYDICSWNASLFENTNHMADAEVAQSEICKNSLKHINNLYMTFNEYNHTLSRLLLHETFEAILLESKNKCQFPDLNGVIESLNSRTGVFPGDPTVPKELSTWNCSIIFSKEESSKQSDFMEVGDLFTINQKINGIPVKYLGIICSIRRSRENSKNVEDLCFQLKQTPTSKVVYAVELICVKQTHMPDPGNRFYCRKIKSVFSPLLYSEAIKKVNDSPLKSTILNPLTFPIKSQPLSTSNSLKANFKMNKVQSNIVHSIMSSIYDQELPTISLICGPAASGKTSVIVALMLQILDKEKSNGSDKKKILLCSRSFSTLDAVASQLLAQNGNIQLIICCQTKRHEKYEIHKQVETRLGTAHASDVDRKQMEKTIFQNADVIITTLGECRKIIDKLYPNGLNDNENIFSCCIVDGACESIEPEQLMPLFLNITNFVLVGDPNTSSPQVQSKASVEYGLETSLFNRCKSQWESRAGAPYYELTDVYKMHPEIARFPLDNFYESKNITIQRNPYNPPLPFSSYIVINHNIPFSSPQAYEKEAQLVIDLLILMCQNPVFQTLKPVVLADGSRFKSITTKYKETDGLLSSTYCGISTVENSFNKHRDVIIMCRGGISHIKVGLTRALKCMIILGNFSSETGDSIWGRLVTDSKKRNKYFTMGEETEASDIIKFILNNR